MNITRRSFLAGVAGLIAVPEFFPTDSRAAATTGTKEGTAHALPPVSLRGFGSVSAVYRHIGDAALTHITCESHAKALLTQAKYLSDLERIPGTLAATLQLHGHEVSVHKAALGGIIACCASERDVLIVVSESEERVAALLTAVAANGLQPADFLPRVKVPMY